MKWSILDPKNQATLRDVQQTFGVSAERVQELKRQLAKAKQQLQGEGEVVVVEGSVLRSAPPARKADAATGMPSRRDVLQVVNEPAHKSAIKGRLLAGEDLVYVCGVKKKTGATRVYKLGVGRDGRIRLATAIPNNPHGADRSGFYTLEDAPADKTGLRVFKAKRQSTGAADGRSAGKRRKPVVQLGAVLKV